MSRSIVLIIGIVAVLAASGCIATPITTPKMGEQMPAAGAGDQEGEGVVSPPAFDPAETPREAFEAYRKAIDERDVGAFKNSIPSDMLAAMEEQIPGGMTDENFKQLLALMSALLVPAGDIVIGEETIDGDSANWTVSDKNDPNNTGTIKFVKEDGTWKLLKEEWESSV